MQTFKQWQHIILVCLCLTYFTLIVSRSIHVDAMASFHSLYDWVIFHYMCVPFLLCLFLCQWTLRLLPYLGYCKQCCCEYWCACIFLELVFFLDLCPGMGLQGHIATPFFILWGTPVLFSTVAVPVYIPTSCVGELPISTPSPAFNKPPLHVKNRMLTSIQSTAKGLKLGASRGAAEMKTTGLKRWFYRRSFPRDNSCLPYQEI